MRLEFGNLVRAYLHVLIKRGVAGSVAHLNLTRARLQAQLHDVVACAWELAINENHGVTCRHLSP